MAVSRGACSVTPPRHFKVGVTDHARERARARFPGYKAARIMDEVRLALGEGRVSATKPEWVSGSTDPDVLYAWTEDGVRVFVLWACKRDGGESFVVKTVMRSDGSCQTA